MKGILDVGVYGKLEIKTNSKEIERIDKELEKIEKKKTKLFKDAPSYFMLRDIELMY